MWYVTVTSESGKLTSAITPQGIEEIEVRDGDQITAIFKAADVTLQKA